MKDNLIKVSTPEEAELAIKKAELDKLSQILAEKELDLEEGKQLILSFQRRYYSQVGIKYVELDEIRAQIAELQARQTSQDRELKKKAEKARTQAEETSKEYEGIDIESPANVLTPEESQEAKILYRKIASLIHPDKATDDKSRNLRTQLMAELNRAYASKDIAKMHNILERWQESPDAVPGEDTASELIRTIRAIAQIKRRISEVEDEIADIIKSDIYELMKKIHDADIAGRDLLKEMSIYIDAEIKGAKQKLKQIQEVENAS